MKLFGKKIINLVLLEVWGKCEEKHVKMYFFIEDSNYLEKYKQFVGFGSVVEWLEEHLMGNDLLIFFLLETQKVVTKTNSDYCFWTEKCGLLNVTKTD